MKKVSYLFLTFIAALFLGSCSSDDKAESHDPKELSSEQVVAKLQGRWKTAEDGDTWYYQFISVNQGYRFRAAEELDSSDLLIQPFDFNYNNNLKTLVLDVWKNGRPEEEFVTNEKSTKITFELEKLSDKQIDLNQGGEQYKWENLKISGFGSIIGTWKEKINPDETDPEITTLVFNKDNNGLEIVTYQGEDSESPIEYKLNSSQGLLEYTTFYEGGDSESSFFIILEFTKTRLQLLSSESIETYNK